MFVIIHAHTTAPGLAHCTYIQRRGASQHETCQILLLVPRQQQSSTDTHQVVFCWLFRGFLPQAIACQRRLRPSHMRQGLANLGPRYGRISEQASPQSKSNFWSALQQLCLDNLITEKGNKNFSVKSYCNHILNQMKRSRQNQELKEQIVVRNSAHPPPVVIRNGQPVLIRPKPFAVSALSKKPSKKKKNDIASRHSAANLNDSFASIESADIDEKQINGCQSGKNQGGKRYKNRFKAAPLFGQTQPMTSDSLCNSGLHYLTPEALSSPFNAPSDWLQQDGIRGDQYGNAVFNPVYVQTSARKRSVQNIDTWSANEHDQRPMEVFKYNTAPPSKPQLAGQSVFISLAPQKVGAVPHNSFSQYAGFPSENKSVHSKLYQQGNRVRKSQAECDRDRENRELQACTFQPNFIGKQAKLRSQMAQLKNQLRGVADEQEETDNNHFSSAQLQLVNAKKGELAQIQKVSQRLYDQGQEKEMRNRRKAERVKEEQMKNECPFQPRINKRTLPRCVGSFTQSNNGATIEHDKASQKYYFRCDNSGSQNTMPKTPTASATAYLNSQFRSVSRQQLSSMRRGHSARPNASCSHSPVSFGSRSLTPKISQKIFDQKVKKEWLMLLSQLNSEKKRVGLIFDEFVALLTKNGYGRIEDIDLLSRVFNASACSAKDVNGLRKDPQFKQSVRLMSVDMLHAVVLAIRNVFDLSVLRGKRVDPDYLAPEAPTKKLKSETWHLDWRVHFQRFHRVLLPLNQKKSDFEQDQRAEICIQKLIDQRKKSAPPTSFEDLHDFKKRYRSKESGAHKHFDPQPEFQSPPLPTPFESIAQAQQSILTSHQKTLNEMRPKVSLRSQIKVKLEKLQRLRNQQQESVQLETGGEQQQDLKLGPSQHDGTNRSTNQFQATESPLNKKSNLIGNLCGDSEATSRLALQGSHSELVQTRQTCIKSQGTLGFTNLPEIEDEFCAQEKNELRSLQRLESQGFNQALTRFHREQQISHERQSLAGLTTQKSKQSLQTNLVNPKQTRSSSQPRDLKSCEGSATHPIPTEIVHAREVGFSPELLIKTPSENSDSHLSTCQTIIIDMPHKIVEGKPETESQSQQAELRQLDASNQVVGRIGKTNQGQKTQDQVKELQDQASQSLLQYKGYRTGEGSSLSEDVDFDDYDEVCLDVENDQPRYPIVIPSREQRNTLQSLELTIQTSRENKVEVANDLFAATGEREAQPIIYLDVTIGEGKQAPLIIYADENCWDIAETFCEFNEIVGIKKNRLFKAVEAAMQSVFNASYQSGKGSLIAIPEHQAGVSSIAPS